MKFDQKDDNDELSVPVPEGMPVSQEDMNQDVSIEPDPDRPTNGGVNGMMEGEEGTSYGSMEGDSTGDIPGDIDPYEIIDISFNNDLEQSSGADDIRKEYYDEEEE